MKITVENLVNEFPAISGRLPENLVDAYPTIEKNLHFYGKSEKIDAVVNRFIESVNSHLKSEDNIAEKQPKAKATSKAKPPKPEVSKFVKMTKQIADIILEQLGGRQFIAMTGAKNFKIGEREFYFNLTRNKTASNILGIKLGADDTYYLTFYKGKTPLKTYDMIYCDQLQDIFEDYTGLYVTLHPRTSDRYGSSMDEEENIRFEPESPEPEDKEEVQIEENPKPKVSPKKTKQKQAKSKPAPKPKKEKQGDPMVLIPLELVFIKAYCDWHGKVKTKTEVYTFIKRLQKAIVERKIRKDSGHAEKIEYIQNRLIAFYNSMKSGTKTYEIPEKWLTELKKVSNIRWADHVVVIKQYINILNQTKTGLKEKAQNLLKTIETSRYADIAKEAIDAISRSLKDYLEGKTEAPEINEMALQGLYGLAGLSGLGNLPAAASPATDNKILSATDFKNTSFKLMGFTGKWLQLIGDPSVPFKMMVWGTGGSGKSTLAIEFARYLAGTLNKRVLYVANEEGAGATLHEKMTRLNAFHPNLFITKTLPSRLVEYDFVFCDSANSMQMDLPKFEQTAKLYPQLSWVLLFQTTKDGKFLGEKNWQHAVDVEVYCEEGKARALKSRFGGKDRIVIYENL